MDTFVKKICSECGSDKIQADAFAEWDTTCQEWRLVNTFYKGAACAACGKNDVNVEELTLTGKAARKARMFALAMDHGWLPGDEDTAEQFCRDAHLLDKDDNPKTAP